MLYLSHAPGPPLADFVDQIWYYQGAPRAHAFERLLPDGCLDLIVNLHEDRIRVYQGLDTGSFQTLPGTLLVGAYTRCNVIDTVCQQCVAGVHFRPGGAYPFFHPPVSEAYNIDIPLEDLWQRDARRLREQLLEAPSPQLKIRTLEKFLLTRLARPLEKHAAVAYAVAQFENMSRPASVGWVSERIGLTPRRFLQIFSEQVGMPPKLFSRLRRFQAVLGVIRNKQQMDWTGVALDCGYYDQAHFIHDFREFSGTTPVAYHQGPPDFQNHIPIEA